MKKSLIKSLFLLVLSCLSFDLFAQLTSGLTSIWEFNETTGTIVIDALEINNGTNYGATTNQTGKLDKSYFFSTSNYVLVNHNTSLAFGTGNISISSWVKTDNLAWEMIVAKTLSGRGFQFYKTNDGKLRFNIGTNTGVSTSRTYKTSSSTITSGNFTHIAVVWTNSSGTIDLYINGALENGSYGDQNANGSDVTNTNSIYVGADQVNSRWYFTGNIDQTAIWNRALSASEISTLYNSGNGSSYTQWIPALSGGTISPSTQTIASGTLPQTLNNTTGASGGTGTYSYQWQNSTNGSTYNDISGATATSYSPPASTINTWFRRKVTSGPLTAYSNVSQITVTLVLSGGTISPSTLTIASGTSPGTISNSTIASGGTGTYSYQWQNSTNGSTYTDISGATATTYTALSLTQNTWYRRKVTSGSETAYSNVSQITINGTSRSLSDFHLSNLG